MESAADGLIRVRFYNDVIGKIECAGPVILYITDAKTGLMLCFSDESRFSLCFADCRVRLYRRLHERYPDGCVVERDKFGGGSVMVWSAINNDFRFELVLLHGNLTAQRYMNEVLAPALVPLLQHHATTVD